MVADQIPPPRWHQDRELAQQLRGLRHQLGPAIGQRALQPVGQPAVGQGPKALQRDRSAGTAGEQASEPCAIVGVPVDSCVQRKSFDEGGVALAFGRGVLARGLPVRQRGVLDALQEVERVWFRRVGRRTQLADQPAGDPAQQCIEISEAMLSTSATR